MNRSLDWMAQAKADLEHARKSIAITDYDWACFAAQQAAEKAVKALHLSRGTVAWGRSVAEPDAQRAIDRSARVVNRCDENLPREP